MHKYEIIIYWSDEDQVFIAEVPELPGCMTHGETQTAALTNANEAIQGWIDTANKFGDPVPKPRGRQPACGPSKFKYKGQTHAERLHSKRRSNPRGIANLDRTQARMNPKAHQA